MGEQLTFEWPVKAALGREDFLIVPSNELAVAAIEGWRNWPGARLLLRGPLGSGKTHLAHVWAAETEAALIEAVTLNKDAVDGLAKNPFLVVENAHLIAGSAAREQALFHLYNLMQSRGGRLLITATGTPTSWGLGLPDLLSRLQSMTQGVLKPFDDMLLAALMVKLFADRQIEVGADLVPYLLDRIDRSPAAVGAVVARLDKAALQRKRPVTRRLAAEVLDKDA